MTETKARRVYSGVMRLLRLSFPLLLWIGVPMQWCAAAPASSPLHDYESCSFDDGLQVVSVDSLPPGVQERQVQTSAGERTIQMLAGRRIMFAYGVLSDFFANVKPEVLPDDTWQIEKRALLDAESYMLQSSHDLEPNTSLPPELHHLEVRGFDRNVLQGGTLGFYLLFDNTQHIATSIYLLNQKPLTRHFQTIAQYRELRDHFLRNYTACIAQNQAIRMAAAK